jgi:ArsR family transcriptional regulator
MDVYQAARVGLAVSSVTRLRLLQLADGRRSLGEIAREVGVGPSSVSHHIRILVEAGFVVVGRRGHKRILRKVPDALIPLARALG